MNTPHRPQQVSKYVQACIDKLAQTGLGRYLSIGGAFGLAHYHEYRSTLDLDVWWLEQIPSAVRQQIIEVLSSAIESFGDVKVRAWGEVVSIDLSENSRKVFSVQIADRSVQLGEVWVGIWTGDIAVDTLNDLIASKMVALVERGAPRDFRDIFTVCQQGLCQVNECWALWHQRQKLANEDSDPQRAILAIQTHLARLEKARPLERIEDGQQRLAAQQLRTWYHEVFVYGFNH